MPAWYVTISTPIGEKHKVIRGEEVKTREDAIARIQEMQQAKSWKTGLPMCVNGEITDCIPAKWPDHFKRRPSALDSAYPAPLTREQLLK